MNFIKLLSVIAIFCVSTLAFGATQAKEYGAEFAFNHGQGFQNYQLGTKVVREQIRVLKVQYDFAKLGGAIGTKNLLVPATAGGPSALSGVLPKNALIVGCYIDVTTPATTSASGTIALGTGQTGVDLKAALAAASYTGIVACIPTGTAASAIKLTADSTPTFTIATGAITAGKFNILIEYILSDY